MNRFTYYVTYIIHDIVPSSQLRHVILKTTLNFCPFIFLRSLNYPRNYTLHFFTELSRTLNYNEYLSFYVHKIEVLQIIVLNRPFYCLLKSFRNIFNNMQEIPSVPTPKKILQMAAFHCDFKTVDHAIIKVIVQQERKSTSLLKLRALV